ncbi:MAG: glycosyltransferase [Bacteroidota bacterium]
MLIFVFATGIQLLFWIFIFSRLAFYRQPIKRSTGRQSAEPPVSIIICARNEAQNLEKNLPRILNQNYRSYEVIVVNDNSTDETANILLKFHIKYPILQLLNVSDKPKGSGKKPALALGIQAAKHDVLLFTDADCQPASKNWLREMQELIRDRVEIGLGYGPYFSERGFLNKFIRFETIFTAIQYFSFALAGYPYMGVGRNLIYKKRLFEAAGGFDKHAHLLSGDDDLLVNEVANRNNVRISLNQGTFVYSTPKKSWKAYYRQKARHLSTGKHYKLQHQVLLGLVSTSHFFHYLGGIALVILKTSTIFVFLLYVVRVLVVLLICERILRKLEDPTLFKWIPLLDAVYVWFYLVFALPLLTGKINRWT